MPTRLRPLPRPGLLRIAALLVASMLIVEERADAQLFGTGASPGRGSYRPPGLWNGPFYSAPHWNPWAARPPASTGYIYTPALDPPYTNAPRAANRAYLPERGTIHSYQEGFSPYSGYAEWYKKSYGVNPSAADTVAATNRYFRSSPIPANPAYLAPSVNAAFAEVARANAAATAAARATPTAPATAPPRVIIPPAAAPAHLPGQAVIYRGVGAP